MFFSKIELRIKACNSLLCIGLDPHINQLSDKSAEGAKQFCITIINNTHAYAAAYKPNSAFFEQFGSDGLIALKEVIKAIPSDIPVILDCKRGDIDSTAQAYAIACYDMMEAHAVTLSPYMGWDSIAPFVTEKYNDKGAFILCKTSNKSSNSLQKEVTYGGSFLYEKVLGLVNDWNSSVHPKSGDCVGVVAGATDIESLQKIRELSPSVWILCPGVGAQGGEADKVCPVGLRADGMGMLISVSRGISKASNMAEAAQKLRDEINTYRARSSSAGTKRLASEALGPTSSTLLPYQKHFIDFAISQSVLQFGSFKLKSGRISPYFFNAGLFCSGTSLVTLSSSYAKAIRASGIEFDVIFGPAYKGIPLANALAMSWSMLYNESKDISYNRKEAKDHGEGGVMVGASVKDRRVLIVDDVITAGTAIREAVDLLAHMGAKIVAVSVCLDRQEKTSETSDKSAIQQVEEEYGFPVISVVKLNNLIEYIESRATDTSASLSDIKAYRDKYGVQ